MVGGTVIGGVLALLLFLGFDYLGNVEAGPLATLVGVLLGGVYVGAAGRGVRGTDHRRYSWGHHACGTSGTNLALWPT